jgi:shikimate 5-dehydrogenase
VSPISGATRLLGVIADPVAQARSPAMANALLDERGRLGDFALVPMHVPAGALALALAVARLRALEDFAGAIVSMPHKSFVPALVDELDDAAREVPEVTPLLALARDLGRPTHGGVPMLAAQMPLMLDFMGAI